MGYRGLSVVSTVIIAGFLALRSGGRETAVVYSGQHPMYGNTRLVMNESTTPQRVTVERPDVYFTLLDFNKDNRYDTATIHRGQGFSRGRLERGVSFEQDAEIEQLERIARETVTAARRGELRRVDGNSQ